MIWVPRDCNKFLLNFIVTPEYIPIPINFPYRIFSRMKMEEYIEFSSIFPLKPVAENTWLGSLESHFTHVKVKLDLFILVEFCVSNIIL